MACREMPEHFPSARWRRWWGGETITSPSRWTALGMVEPEVVGLPEKALTLDATRRFRFGVHAAGWLHPIMLHRCSSVAEVEVEVVFIATLSTVVVAVVSSSHQSPN